MKVITFYIVSDTFTADGLGRSTVIGNFFNKSDAYEYAKGRGNYGSDARVREETLIIHHSIDEVETVKQEQKRQKALTKLTDEEKELLGLK